MPVGLMENGMKKEPHIRSTKKFEHATRATLSIASTYDIGELMHRQSLGSHDTPNTKDQSSQWSKCKPIHASRVGRLVRTSMRSLNQRSQFHSNKCRSSNSCKRSAQRKPTRRIQRRRPGNLQAAGIVHLPQATGTLVGLNGKRNNANRQHQYADPSDATKVISAISIEL